jgi:hypothetical protein
MNINKDFKPHQIKYAVLALVVIIILSGFIN